MCTDISFLVFRGTTRETGSAGLDGKKKRRGVPFNDSASRSSGKGTPALATPDLHGLVTCNTFGNFFNRVH